MVLRKIQVIFGESSKKWKVLVANDFTYLLEKITKAFNLQDTKHSIQLYHLHHSTLRLSLIVNETDLENVLLDSKDSNLIVFLVMNEVYIRHLIL